MKVKALAVNGAALGLLMVNVPTDVPLTTMLAGATAKVMAGESAAATMTMVTFCVALGGVPLAACTVRPNEPAVVGVPLNWPLVALSARPGGTVPVAIDQVIGVVPVAVKV